MYAFLRRVLILLFGASMFVRAETSPEWTTPIAPFQIADNLDYVRSQDLANHTVSYPGIAEDFQKTFATLRALPCDVFLGAHGEYFDMLTKLGRYPKEGPSAFVDPEGCKDYVATAQEHFDHELIKQQAATAP